MSNSGSNNGSAAGGIGFFGALCIAFIILKLLHVIDWSWWVVLAPVWIPTVLVILIFTVIILIMRR